MRRPMTFALLLVLAAFGASSASALELIMFRRAGCPWCAVWDREVGPIYPKTDIGRRLPMRLVDLDRGDEMKAPLKRPVRYTPTFVLHDGSREIGRIEGYPGQDFFWGLLENLVPKAEPDAVGARQ